MSEFFSMLALPIFPCSRPQSIVGASELNFCVRDGNRWTLTAINTNCYQVSLKTTLLYYSFCICQVVFFISAHHKQHNELVASGNDEQCYTLSNAACRIAILRHLRGVAGDPYRIRTDVNGVRGRCLNHLTNGPCVSSSDKRQ